MSTQLLQHLSECQLKGITSHLIRVTLREDAIIKQCLTRFNVLARIFFLLVQICKVQVPLESQPAPEKEQVEGGLAACVVYHPGRGWFLSLLPVSSACF